MGRLKRVLSILLTIATLTVAVGCNGAGKGSDDNGNTGKDEGLLPKATSIEQSEDFDITSADQKLYDALFDINSQVKISIDIPEAELAKIQKDYDKYNSFGSKSPIYRMCTLTIEINGEKYVLEEVGIRMKGNTSRRDFYDTHTGEVYNLIHFKISFQETFDEEEYYGDDAKVWTDDAAREARKDRTFASLEGLELKYNRNIDSTYMRETYAYKMYRDFGVLAPNNTLGRCEVNGDNWGLYKVYEPVDKVFIKRYFDEEDAGGDLYKCGWSGWENANYTKTGGVIGIEDEDRGLFYAYDLKTNKKTSNHEKLENMIQTINGGDVSREELESVVDIDNWLRFMAVSYFLGMPDDLRNNYNNHYVYFKESTGQAVFIAYDCEISLGIDTWNPTGNYMTETNPYSGWAYGINDSQKNPLIKNTVSAGGLYIDEFKEALDDVANSKWMSFNTYEVMFGEIYGKYRGYAIPDIDIKKIDKKFLEMSIDDTLENGRYSNNNMTVEEYLTVMLENYYAHRDEN